MADQPHLILMAGLPGSGKSTLALALGDELGWPVIDKDVILSAMLDNIPEHLAQTASYAVMLALGRDIVGNQRRSAILDSPATWSATIKAALDMCRDGNAVLHVVLCLADRETRNQRVRSRDAQRSQPIGVSTTTGTGIERFQHLPTDTLHIDMEQPLDVSVATVLSHVHPGAT